MRDHLYSICSSVCIWMFTTRATIYRFTKFQNSQKSKTEIFYSNWVFYLSLMPGINGPKLVSLGPKIFEKSRTEVSEQFSPNQDSKIWGFKNSENSKIWYQQHQFDAKDPLTKSGSKNFEKRWTGKTIKSGQSMFGTMFGTE